MFKLLARLSGKEFLMIIIAIGFIFAGVWLDLKLPEFTGAIARAISPVPDPSNPPYGVMAGGTMGDVWHNGFMMLLAAAGSMITVIIVGYISAIISASFSTRIRQSVFEKVGSYSTAEMRKFSVPSLITRSTNDVTQVRMFVAMGMQLIIKAPITAVWAVLKITSDSWELSLVTIFAVVAMTVMIVLIIFLVLPRFRRIQTLNDKLNQVSRENISGIRVVRAYNAESYEEAKFEKANNNLMVNNLFTYRAFGIMMPFMSLLLSGLGLAIWWVTGGMLNAGKVSPAFVPNVMEFNQYAFQIVFSFMMLIMIFVMLPRVTVSARRINEVLNTKVSIVYGQIGADAETGAAQPADEKSGAETGTSKTAKTKNKALKDAPVKGGTVEFKNVSFKYPDAEGYILKDINLNIKSGQTIAFIGSTGSGKSTLINLVARLYDVTDGEVILDGENVKNYSQEKLHDKVGYIPQTAVLFGGTIASNIAFGTVNGKPIDEAEIKRALDIAQATEFVSKLEKGIQSDVSQGGKNLSGGQKQRIAIARVVARRPEVFIFDDTFSALDYKTDKNLRAALKKECEGVTVLIVAQRIGTIKDADLIVVLDAGTVVGQGTHSELLETCAVYKEIAYSQLSKEELK